jgi:hypothetical protein
MKTESGLTEKLVELARLHKDGSLSDEEFGSLKSKLIAGDYQTARDTSELASLAAGPGANTPNPDDINNKTSSKSSAQKPIWLLVGLALIALIVFAEEMKKSVQTSQKGLVGADRTAFVFASIQSCERSMRANNPIADGQPDSPLFISQYCNCMSNHAADRLSYNDVKHYSEVGSAKVWDDMKPMLLDIARFCLADTNAAIKAQR